MTKRIPRLPAIFEPGRFDPEWENLFNQFADGVATPEDAGRLHELLSTNPEARRAYREFASIHASLHWDYTSLANRGMPPGAEKASGTGPEGPRGRWIAAILVASILSAAAATAMVAAWLPGRSERTADAAPKSAPTTPAADVPSPAGVKPLATVTNARFSGQADPATRLAPGQPIEAGRFNILSGAVELTLRNGVEIVLEGPGELELVDDLEAFLHRGTAVVRMPKGMHGFRLSTPSTEVLDMGTEFAVKYGGDFVTDVQVYDGAVIAAARSSDRAGAFPKRLEAGQAARFSSKSSDSPVPLPYREGRFIRRLPTDKGIEHRGFTGSPDVIAANEIRQFGHPRTGSIVVARAAEPPTIDGRLDEWERVPGVTASLGLDADAEEWMDGRMMYDDTHLYIAARVGDPHPLSSTIDPVLDPEDGWRGGAVQVRLSTDRTLRWPVNASAPNYYRMRNIEPTPEQRDAAVNPQLSHITMWFHAATATPCLTIAHGMQLANLRVNPSGFRGAYSRAADGRGYTLEYAIAWSLLNCETDPPRPGDDLAASWQVLFSDEGGRLWRTQIVEVRNPAEPGRIYTWERAATWGRAEYR